MVKLTVLYGHPDDPEAFEEYYAGTHMPMVPKIPNLIRYEVARVVGTPNGGEPPYYRIFEGYFENMESLQAGMSTPEGQAPPADLPNFATGGATIFISEIDG
jgi:uncharacterized protein (TIGR02118 family)